MQGLSPESQLQIFWTLVAKLIKGFSESPLVVGVDSRAADGAHSARKNENSESNFAEWHSPVSLL